MKANQNAFDIINDEESSFKIQKAHLAIKYLDFLSNEIKMTEDTLSINEQIRIIKNMQSLNALNFTLYFLRTENFDSLNQPCKAMITRLYVSLIKALHSINPKSILQETSCDEEWKVFCQLIDILRIQSQNSAEFCVEYSECDHSYDILFKILDNFERNEHNNELSSNLIISLLSLSKHHKKYQTLWSTESRKVLENFSLKLSKIDTINIGHDEWYIFLIHTNLRKESDFFDHNFNFTDKSNNTENIIAQKLDLGIKYLKHMNEPVRITNSYQCMNIIYYLTKYSESIHFQTLEASLQDYFVGSSITLIKFLYEEIKNEFKQADESANKKIVKRNLVLIDKLSNIILNCSNESLTYCSRFHKVNDSLKNLFEFIRDENLSKFLAENIKKKFTANLLRDCFENILCSLHNLSRVSYKYKSQWDSNDAVNVCVQLFELLGGIDDNFRVFIYFILSNIASDQQIETLKEIKMAIEFISELIVNCSNAIENNTATRSKFQIDENDEPQEIVTCLKNNTKYNLIELTEAVYHFSINDKLKIEIYDKCMLKIHLKKLIYNGNEVEKENSIKLMYQLCFDEIIAKDFMQDENILKYIKDIIKNENTQRKQLKRYCEGLLFTLNKLSRDTNASSMPDVIQQAKNRIPESSSDTEKQITEITEKPKHIMISYNRESKDLCMKIKLELEKLNYNVWIDFENIRGSSLESMANAIEDSECVLMGMTEKYKLSSNCRLEAEYAVQLNKPVIPLILQKDYKPDGWLGIILGSKMYINFKKYEWQECIRRLMVEVTNVYKKSSNNKSSNRENENTASGKSKQDEAINDTNKDNNKHQDQTNSLINSNDISGVKFASRLCREKTKKVYNWSETDIEKWLDEKKFNINIVNILKPNIDGKILFQMYTMLRNTPEFFYTALRTDSDNKILLKDVALFSFELGNLFEVNEF